jgi:hypothetical protein
MPLQHQHVFQQFQVGGIIVHHHDVRITDVNLFRYRRLGY